MMKIKYIILMLLIVFLLPLSNERGYPFSHSSSSAPSETEGDKEENEYICDFRHFQDQNIIFSIMQNHLHEHLISIPRTELKAIISSVMDCSHKYGMTPELIFSLIHTESTFNSRAISNKGAIGLMQIMPTTAEGIARELNVEWSGREMLYDPVINIEFGTYYLHDLLKNFNDMDTALSAYNIGPTKISKAIGKGSFHKSRFSSVVKRRSEQLSFLANIKSI